MIYFWLFQIISLLFLLVSRYFFGVAVGPDMLILSLLLLISTPVIVPLVATIRGDMTPMRSLLTQAGCIGLILIIAITLGIYFRFQVSFSTLIFWMLALLAVFFRFESRIFFLVGIMGLIVTVSALLVDMSAFAESASVVVYLSLVLGVLTEIVAPVFDTLHNRSRKLIVISPEFRRGYRQALADYTWILTITIEVIFIIVWAGRGIVWNFDYRMLLYLAFLVWIFFSIYLFATESPRHIRDFVSLRISHESLLSVYRYNRTPIHYAIFLGAAIFLFYLIDWAILWQLPFITLSAFVVLIILSTCVCMYSIISYSHHR
ncbi:hypothetical protein H7169_00495 [Candidatus Gracilibacteria bacterium]|nr:hypothetical protein [Candidatus Gracilibacteria bacterium]